MGWAGYGAFTAQQIFQVPASNGQQLTSLSVDANGNFIVTGFAVGGFLKKLDPEGNVLFTFTNFGAYSAGTTVDANGDIYWIGTAGVPGFQPFPFTKVVLPTGLIQSDTGTPIPGFVAKLSGKNGSVIWADEIDAMQPTAIVLDGDGQITLAGYANTAPGITTFGAYQTPSTGNVKPAELVRLTGNGDVVFAATYGGQMINGVPPYGCRDTRFVSCVSDPITEVSSILLDSQGHIWIAGSTNEIDVPITLNALKPTCGCSAWSGDGFLAEFSADASTLLYATYLGTSTQSPTDQAGNDSIASAAMDGSGLIWMAGATNGTDLPVTTDAVQSTLHGNSDGFVFAYDPLTNQITYASYYGMKGDNAIGKILAANDGSVIVSGVLGSNKYDPYSFGSDFVASLRSSEIDVTPFFRYAADAGLAFGPSGSVAVEGRQSVVTVLENNSSSLPNILSVANSASLSASGQVNPGEIHFDSGHQLRKSPRWPAAQRGPRFIRWSFGGGGIGF